jgi:hypothetical protein
VRTTAPHGFVDSDPAASDLKGALATRCPFVTQPHSASARDMIMITGAYPSPLNVYTSGLTKTSSRYLR